jgi:hypothetical protein
MTRRRRRWPGPMFGMQPELVSIAGES